MELGAFFKPPGANTVPNAQVAWDRHGRKSIGYPKKDGWRFQIHADGQRIALFSRSGRDYANKLAATTRQIAQQIADHPVILDAETA